MALLFSVMHDLLFDSEDEEEEEEVEEQKETETEIKMKIKEEKEEEEEEEEAVINKDEIKPIKKESEMKLELELEKELEIDDEYYLIEEVDEQQQKGDTIENIEEIHIKDEIEHDIEEAEDSIYEVQEYSIYDEEDESSTEPKSKRLKSDIPSRKMFTYVKPTEMEEDSFLESFGLNKYAFNKLLNYIEPKMKVQYRNSCIPNPIKLAILLKFCVYGSYQKSMGSDFYFNLAQPTVSSVIQEMLNILEENICPRWIKFKRSDEELFRGKQYFYREGRFPSVIGVVDTTHVKIVGPEKDIQHLYCNSAKSFSLNVLIVCDHNKLIRYIDARNPGCVDDWDVWEMSNLDKYLHEHYSNKKNGWLLGGTNLPLKPYLMTPFRDAKNNSLEERYNHGHYKAKIIIDETIQILKSRFKCLLGVHPLYYAPEKVTQIVNVCAALHNICVKLKIPEPESMETIDKLGSDITYLENTKCKKFRDGKSVRQTILECFSKKFDK